MPVDPSVIGRLQPVKINTPFENLDVVMKARSQQSQADYHRARAEDEQRQLREHQIASRILQESQGDWETAIPRLRQAAPQFAAEIEKTLSEERRARASAIKDELETEKVQTDKWLARFRAMPEGDDEMYQRLRQMAVEDDPDADGFLPPQYDKAALDQVQTIGLTSKEHLERQQKSLDLLLEGKWRTGIGIALSTATNPEDYTEILEGAREMGAPKSELALFDRAFSPAAVQKAALLTMTPEERAQAADRAAGREIQREGHAITMRGQDVSAETQRRGQDISTATQRRGQDMTEARARIAPTAPGPGATTGPGAMPLELATALDRVTFNMPGTRRPAIIALANRLAAAGDIEQLKDLIRQAAIETEPVDSRNQIVGRLGTVSALRDIKAKLQELNRLGVSTNILRGTAEDVARKLGTSTDPRLARIGAQIRDSFIQYRRSITGAAFSKEEGADYEKLSPNYGNTLPLNEALIDGLIDSMATRDREFWNRKLGSKGADLVGAIKLKNEASGPRRRHRPIPDIPGGIAELRNGRWIRVK